MEKGNYRGETGLLKKNKNEAKSFLPVYSIATFMQPRVQGSRAEALPLAKEQEGEASVSVTPVRRPLTAKYTGNSHGPGKLVSFAPYRNMPRGVLCSAM